MHKNYKVIEKLKGQGNQSFLFPKSEFVNLSTELCLELIITDSKIFGHSDCKVISERKNQSIYSSENNNGLRL